MRGQKIELQKRGADADKHMIKVPLYANASETWAMTRQFLWIFRGKE